MRTLPNMLRNEALRKPAVKALLDRVYDLTDEEIDNANVPMKWYKDALRMIRSERASEVLAGTIQDYAVSGRTKDHLGMILRFAAMDAGWVKMGNTEWQLAPGDLVFVTGLGHGWYGQSWFKSLPKRDQFEIVESGVGHARYYELYLRHVSDVHFDAPVIEVGGQSAPVSAARSRMASLGVRIG